METKPKCPHCGATDSRINGQAPRGGQWVKVRLCKKCLKTFRGEVAGKQGGEMKHTPGSWISKPTAGHNTHGQSVIYSEKDGNDIAIIYDGEANAQLIAAAPELLEALKTIMDIYHAAIWSEHRAKALAAINKAEGR